MVLKRVALVGLLVGVAAVGACTTVRRVDPAALLADDGPALVWATETNNTVVTVAEPVIRRDTLRGKLNGKIVKIPLSEIQSIQAKMPNHAKTALLAITLGVAAVSTVYVLAISKEGPGGDGSNCGQTVRGDPILAC
jgi:hypothetical protein